MRDIPGMAETLRAIHASVFAQLKPQAAQNWAWFAGTTPLNTQTVQDLLADGWLVRLQGPDLVIVAAWPIFAGPLPEGACAD